MNKIDLDQLNREFAKLNYLQRIELFYASVSTEDVLMTSSFGTSAAFLLHLVNENAPKQMVHFIDTQYLFEETLKYRDELVRLWNIRLKTVYPSRRAHQNTLHKKLWLYDTNTCCHTNKVLPLQGLKDKYTWWISGVMGFQNGFRNVLNVFEEQEGILKFHPLIDVSEQELKDYYHQYQLPEHPLKNQGYASLGCTHCTQKGKGREGRWAGSEKQECGLHANYFLEKIQKKKTQES